jgi:hypothetical protein
MQLSSYTPYEFGRIVSRTNGVNSMKQFQIRDIKNKIRRDFMKSIDAEEVTIKGNKQVVLITRDKGDEQIKRIKSMPDEKFDLGDIVNWNGVNYIVYKMDADRRIQSKGRMYECNMKIRWKNDRGEIVERVGKGEDATTYGEGTEGTFRLRIGKFQLKLIVPLDEETVLIERDDRFLIDANSFIETMSENNVLPNAYKVTRRNVTTGTFPDVGYVEITMIEDQFVAGYDDLENMVAARVSDMIKIPDNNGQSGSENEENNGEEGSWL